MAHSAGVTWTCDRCRKQITLDSGKVPDGWQSVRAGRIIAAGPREDNTEREWEICGTCYTQHVERVLMNGAGSESL